MSAAGVGAFSDMKLWPGGGREWDWRETNTHHVPGIQVSDIEELIERGARVVILTMGMQLVLQTCSETLRHLEQRGIRYHQLETKAAVAKYNELAAMGAHVGGVFHSTC